MTIRYYPDLEQGSPEWLDARCGLLTASEMKLIITPTLKIASNEKEKTHLFELLGQRITRYVEPTYVGDAMLRGGDDEKLARALYSEHYAPVTEVGFITNDKWGFIIGYSPDGLVGTPDGPIGTRGAIECKSRAQKYQTQTLAQGKMPDDYLMQVQTGMLVADLEWIDFISYCGGMPMATIRVEPDLKVQRAIIEAAEDFEARLMFNRRCYNEGAETMRLIPTERQEYGGPDISI